MTIYYLYVKTHSVTGLKYLGHTTRNPFKYKGSGLYWSRHLNKHGSDHTTEILLKTTCKKELVKCGLHYSLLWNVEHNPSWANIISESGPGVVQNLSTISKSISTKKTNGTISNGVNAMRDPTIQKKAGLNSRKRYRFISPAGEIIDVVGLANFCKEQGLDPGNMSSIAHGKKQLKTHKGWSCSLISTT